MGGQLAAVGDGLQQCLQGGEQQARRFVVELVEDAQPLTANFIDDALAHRPGVPGGKEDGADTGETVQVLGPEIVVARVG